MSEPRVFLDQDLRRIASYESARSIPLDPSVSLASSDLLLKFNRVAAFYGISGPMVEQTSRYLLDLSLRSTLSRVPYDLRIAHTLGASEGDAAFYDFREPSDHPDGQPTLPYPDVSPVRPKDGTERPSEAPAVSVRGQSDGAAGLAASESKGLGCGLRPFPLEAIF